MPIGTLILAAMALLAGLFYLYPFIGYPLILALLRTKPIQHGACDDPVSLLFCAYNEIECLDAKIANLRELKARYPDLEILVYNDGSTDGTSEALGSADDLLIVVNGPGRTGKAAGMRQLASMARGSILIFTDADVIIDLDAIDRLRNYYADPSVGGVCCSVRMVTAVGTATSRTGTSYWGWDDRIKQLESDTGNVMGASGALFSVRRRLYPEFPDSVQDDFTVSMSVIFQGMRLVKAPDVVAWTNSVSDSSEELNRKMRIGARAWHTHRFLLPGIRAMPALDRFKYVSHKVLRWFGGLFLGVGALFALAAVASLSPVLALALGGLAALGGWAIWRTRGRGFGRIGQVAMATFGTLVGVIRAMKGATVTTWTSAQSR